MASFATGWIDLTLENGWESYASAPAYRIDGQGVVWLRGEASAGASASTLATLPAGARPGAEMVWGGTSNAYLGYGVHVNTDGTIVGYLNSGATNVLLDGIAFLAEN